MPKKNKRIERLEVDSNKTNIEETAYAINVVSKLPNLNKTPNQVLKFIIMQQQKQIRLMSKERQHYKDTIQEMNRALEENNIDLCKTCLEYRTDVLFNSICDRCLYISQTDVDNK